eukprot:12415451-Ditylum_brightwellii.AAC.1
MHELQIDVMALPETQSPWSKQIYLQIQKYGQHICGSFKCIGTSSDEANVGMYKPGGVCLLSQGNIVGRVTKTGTNAGGLGRWCYIKFSCKYDTQFWIIATYRVCQQYRAGNETAYMQQ